MTKELTVQNIDMMNTQSFEQLQRVAGMFSKSDIVPTQYRNNLPNCAIALMQSHRMGVDPFAFMQNSYVVHGRPGIESKLAISLVNGSGLFTDPLEYEEDGDDANDQKNYRVRCVATRKSTGKELKGPWVTWDLVKAEQWDKKPGSKWKTMPQLMFMYRAAMFFARLHCPEVLLGFQTTEELRDVEPRDITNEVEVKESTLSDKIQPKKPATAEPYKQVEKKIKEAEAVNDEAVQGELVEGEPTVEEYRTQLTELLASNCNGDIDAMDALLSEAVGEKVSVNQIPLFNENALPQVLDAVERLIGG